MFSLTFPRLTKPTFWAISSTLTEVTDLLSETAIPSVTTISQWFMCQEKDLLSHTK